MAIRISAGGGSRHGRQGWVDVRLLWITIAVREGIGALFPRYPAPSHCPRYSRLLGERMLALAEEHQTRVVLPDLSRMPDIEYSALQALIEGGRRALWLSGLNPGVLEVVRNAGLADLLGRDRLSFKCAAGEPALSGPATGGRVGGSGCGGGAACRT